MEDHLWSDNPKDDREESPEVRLQNAPEPEFTFSTNEAQEEV